MDKTFLQRICISILLMLTNFTTSAEAIAGGELANFGEFPYSVQLSTSKPGEFFCGGSILAENVILTAAHCLVVRHPFFKHSIMMPSNWIRVTAGSLEFRQKPSGTERRGDDWQMREVSYYVLHPHFDSHQLTKNDIAILFLDQPLNFSEKVRPIELPSSNQTFARGTFAGWGQPDAWNLVSDHLKKLNVAFGEMKSCEAEFSWAAPATVGHFTDEHICSKFPWGVGLCKGDSGSSLVCEEQLFLPGTTCAEGPSSFPVICGVASWVNANESCGRGKSVVAFTNVSKYLHWIYETTEKNGFFIQKKNSSSKEEFPYCGTGLRCIPNFHWFIFVVIAIIVDSFA